MQTTRSSRSHAAIVAGALAAFGACKASDGPHLLPDTTKGLMTSYVALGNSITAGYQSTGINDSTQRESYAFYLAQAAGTRFAYPSLRKPGCPPPIGNFVSQKRVDSLAPMRCYLRSPGSIGYTLNNVAVPGAYVAEPTSRFGDTLSGALNNFILGGRTQVERALEARPTFATVWLGNNDVLIPALTGIVVPVPRLSRGLTPVDSFRTRLGRITTQLIAGAPGLRGALIGVVDVKNLPVLFPPSAFNDPIFRNEFETKSGGPVVVDASCLPGSPGEFSRINLDLATAIKAQYAGASSNIVACQRGAVLGQPLIGDFLVLDATEQAFVSARVDAYNAIIQAKAAELGWAYVDPNPSFTALVVAGQIPPYAKMDSPDSPFGPYLSLDGFHPARRAHQSLANLLIDAINLKYGTTLSRVPLQ